MKIIYHCYGGAHSSVTAAAVHLGWLPTDRIPSEDMIASLPLFDQQTNKDHGHIRLLGIDEDNREIYVAGRRNAAQIFENMVTGVTGILDRPVGEIRLVNVMPYVNWKMVFGGYTSRRLGVIKIGRPVVLTGIRYSYLKIVSLVHQVKMTAGAAFLN
ncbi:MAG: DUF3189 family protein [Bacillota bacterium]